MTDTISPGADLLLRLQVEDLLYLEADLLDRWQLDQWLALYTPDAHYFVPPSDIDGDTADPNESLFYINDDHVRMRERVIRLNKVGAHSEHPRSKVRHLVSNVRVRRDGDSARIELGAGLAAPRDSGDLQRILADAAVPAPIIARAQADAGLCAQSGPTKSMRSGIRSGLHFMACR